MRRTARWYVPTWNGDLRLTPDAAAPKTRTVLTIADPTAEEQRAVTAILGALASKQWTERSPLDPVTDGERIVLGAPLEEVGPLVVSMLRPGPGVLTAVRLKDGTVEVCEHGAAGKGKPTTAKDLAALAQKPAGAAATVSRPTPSCPDCYTGAAITPATECLLSFLDEEQHRTWARERYVVVRGGLTGHRYIVAHRASVIASQNGRICWDADDKDTLHFHDQSVPPEEEVLASMLILRHREPWLRNVATCLGLRFTKVFRNPFGDHMDGVPDAALTKVMGMLGLALVGAEGGTA